MGIPKEAAGGCSARVLPTYDKERCPMTDLYKILGVSEQADAGEIKQAYRKLAKKYHPDLNPGDQEAEKQFKAAAEAYGILGDQDKKKEYDSRRNTASSQFGKVPGNGPFWTGYGSVPPTWEELMRRMGQPGQPGQTSQPRTGAATGREQDGQQQSAARRNPMDLTGMFEAYMNKKMK